MAANQNDYFRKTGANTVTTLAAPGKALAASSITVGSTANYPSDTGIIIGIRQVDSDGVLVPGTYSEWKATVTSGTTFSISTTPVLGSDQVYPAGSTTQVFLPVSSSAHNDLIDGLLEEHNQDGTHADVTATTVTTSGNITSSGTITAASFVQSGGSTSNGWTVGLATPNTVTYNGNGSYDLVFNSVDLTSVLSPGMRLRTTRTVAAPNQCTSLNGSSQYWNKTSPSGITFTDDFVAGAWIKLSSYQSSTIISRWNGTSGWQLQLLSTGQVQLAGYNASSGNYSLVLSSSSIPLNRWVHVAAQLDMSAFTATTTTSYVMIDGLNVISTVTRAGTNPTALVQAGNLEVGSTNGGTTFFPGKIAQAFVSSAKITQANVRTLISQGLTASLISTHSIASAYSFSNSANDLNTTNANNLTAQGSATATNADSPFGTQGSGLISTTLDYGIVHAATFSTNTTVTVQTPEGCTIPTSGGVTSVDYSVMKAPYGFPVQQGKWSLMSLYLASATASSSSTTAYNNLSAAITLPVGSYGRFGYQGNAYAYRVAAATGQVVSLISASAASVTPLDPRLVCHAYLNATGATQVDHVWQHKVDMPHSVSSQTTYYVNLYTELATGGLGWYRQSTNGNASLLIYAENAYV